MPFIPLPNGFKVAMEYTLNGQLVVNVYHVTSTLPVNTTNLTALANVFINWWQTQQRPNFPPAIVLSRVVATDIRAENGQQVTVPVTANNAGTASGASSPNNVAVVLSQRTGFSGRSFRGRTYYAAVPAAEVADNLLSSAYQLNLLNDAQALQTSLSTAGFTWVVFSQRANGSPRVTGIGTPITAFIVDQRVDTQRRRLPGTGE